MTEKETLTKGFLLGLVNSRLALAGGRRPLCRLAAVGGAAVHPQRDLGLVRVPPRQVAEVSWVFGVLVGQLLLEESLEGDDPQVHSGGTSFPSQSQFYLFL